MNNVNVLTLKPCIPPNINVQLYYNCIIMYYTVSIYPQLPNLRSVQVIGRVTGTSVISYCSTKGAGTMPGLHVT